MKKENHFQHVISKYTLLSKPMINEYRPSCFAGHFDYFDLSPLRIKQKYFARHVSSRCKNSLPIDFTIPYDMVPSPIRNRMLFKRRIFAKVCFPKQFKILPEWVRYYSAWFEIGNQGTTLYIVGGLNGSYIQRCFLNR